VGAIKPADYLVVRACNHVSKLKGFLVVMLNDNYYSIKIAVDKYLSKYVNSLKWATCINRRTAMNKLKIAIQIMGCMHIKC